MTTIADREFAYDDWLLDICREYPNCDVVKTRYGCKVMRGDEIIKEYDYEPDPHEAARVRY